MPDIDKYHFGSYFHELLLIELNIEEEEMKVAMKSFLATTPDKTDKDENVLTVSAYLHEMRHFFDCFGTYAGCNMFELNRLVAQEFVTVCLELSEKNIRWELPINEWIKRGTSPAIVETFFNKALSIRNELALYKRPFEPFPREGSNNSHVQTFNTDEGLKVKAFPAHYKSLITKKSGHFLMPIGFETIIEGNAQAVQRSYLNEFQPSNDELLLTRLLKSENGELPIPNSYNVIDHLITRYIRNHGFKNFNRDTSLKLADMSLGLVNINLLQTESDFNFKIEKPDLVFYDLLETFDISELVSGIDYPEEFMLIYSKYLEQLSKIPSWRELEKETHSPLVAIETIWRYVVHNIIIPLIQVRLNSNHSAFGTYDGFIKLFNENKLPHFLAVPSGIKFRNGSSEIFQTWIEYIFIIKIMEQVISNQKIILCPRANRSLPVLNNVNLCFEGNCREWIKRGCGIWYEGTFNDLPNCGFAKTLEKLSFID